MKSLQKLRVERALCFRDARDLGIDQFRRSVCHRPDTQRLSQSASSVETRSPHPPFTVCCLQSFQPTFLKARGNANGVVQSAVKSVVVIEAIFVIKRFPETVSSVVFSNVHSVQYVCVCFFCFVF